MKTCFEASKVLLMSLAGHRKISEEFRPCNAATEGKQTEDEM